MSTLKSFQSEIQEIHARELARQRGRAGGPPVITSSNVQGLEETTNIACQPPPSRSAGAEDEVEAILVLHIHVVVPCICSLPFRLYSLAMTMTAHGHLLHN